MSAIQEALADKCEERAASLVSRYPRSTLITVGDLEKLLLNLAKDIRAPQ